ncbi:hypothetical protein JGH11_04805 [Dysgonomonas sp. Marseille-P4677]|uniref:hypothetical protein n=1 Tax=Dysgonomonas sp. Marseille-P4677 TaxID=2364790 RepID=UPI0019115217|nr:hypothetical protein [Dysgonomonas sp. Marseille-P4677]MBK5720186.1 hypothetical protein [Dysgonomonas sp. Marseille-P4677]
MKYLYLMSLLGLLYGCITTNGKMEKELFSEVDEVYYKTSVTDSIVITDRDKINHIINLIKLSKRSPAVFISRETLIFKKKNQNSVIIDKDKEFFSIEGLTYLMDKSTSRKLSNLLLNSGSASN